MSYDKDIALYATPTSEYTDDKNPIVLQYVQPN